jgi:hypothetical protein
MFEVAACLLRPSSDTANASSDPVAGLDEDALERRRSCLVFNE